MASGPGCINLILKPKELKVYENNIILWFYSTKKIETDVHIFGDRHEMTLVYGQTVNESYYSRINISYAISHI